MSYPVPPPGWYGDPGGSPTLRWWDGLAWTPYTQPVPRFRPSFVRALPWRSWAGWLVVLAVATFICFDHAESTRTANPGGWFGAGLVCAGVITFAGAAWTLGRRRWIDVMVFAAVVAAIAAVALFSVSSASTSRGCANNGQPPSAGTYDCDTSEGLGGPILFAGLYVPAIVLSAAGGGTGRLLRRRRRDQQ